jgi:chemotaxis protein methyltransferase CheR
MRDNEYAFIRDLVYEHSRINLGNEKRELVSTRLSRRLRATAIPTIGDYCQFLKSPSGQEELPHLIDAISTNHTHFFRETPHFDFLVNTVIPEATTPGHVLHTREFNVWSAACSSGEEPYSVAITLADSQALRSIPWTIECSDISYRILKKASLAIYPQDSLRSMTQDQIRRHFDKGHGEQAGRFRVVQALRSRLRFHRLNLISDQYPFQKQFSLILCRNVMIYFDRPTQTELVNRLYNCVRPGGYLFVGHSESLAGIQHRFQYVRPAVYRREP